VALWRELKARPELVPAMIEEALRFESSIQYRIRRVARDVEIAGTRIEKDSHVAVLLASANRDERQFEDPDRFDIHRDTKGHLAFGFGVHFCLGASLARLEAWVTLEALVPELPNLERGYASPRWRAIDFSGSTGSRILDQDLHSTVLGSTLGSLIAGDGPLLSLP
jgi:cytochrome P450